VAGAAWATVIVRIVGTTALFFYIKKSPVSFTLAEKPSNEDATAILKLSTPAAMERLIIRLGHVVCFSLFVKIRADSVADYSIAGNMEMFGYLLGYGLAIAATRLAVQNMGANRPKYAYQYGMISSWVALVFMSIVGIVLFFL